MNKLKRIFILLAIPVLFVSSVSSIILLNTEKASAETATLPRDRAKIHEAVNALAKCATGGGGFVGKGNGELTDKLSQGKFFVTSNTSSNINPILEKYKENDSNPWLRCTDNANIKSLIGDTFGVSVIEFLEGSGLYKGDPNNSKKHILIMPDKDNEWRASKIYDYIKKLTGVDGRDKLSAASQYILLKFTFDRACKIRKYSEGSVSGTGKEGAQPVMMVDDKNASYKIEYWTIAKNGDGSDKDGGKQENLNIGYGFNKRMTCEEIRIAMNSTATAYVDKLKELQAQGEDTDPSASTTGANRTSDGSTDADSNPTCEMSGNPLSWIICPVINGIAEVSDFMLQNFIAPMLVSRDIGYTNPEEGIYKAWSSFRVIANIMLIIALLVIVFGQSIGGGMIDSYTIKKAVPRLFAAAILINISIYIVAFALDITNIVGAGLSNIIYAAFQGAGEFKLQLSVLGTVGPFAAIGVGGAIAGAGIWAMGGASVGLLPMLLLFVVIPAVLAIIAVFATLIIRQGIIILLVIVSPLAFMAFVLPNTEKFFRQWWGLLFKTLLVYPIVMLIFAISDVLAAVLSGNFPMATQWMADLVSIILLIIPMFLIPFAFKFSGGAIGSLYGTLNGLGKKASEIIKGDARDPLSLRNRAKHRARTTLNDADMSGAAIGTRLNPFIRGDRQKGKLTAIRNTTQAILGTDIAQSAMFKSEADDDKPMADLALFKSGAESRGVIQYQADLDTEKVNNDGSLTAEARQAKLQEIEQTKAQRLAASATADRIGRNSANRRLALMQGSTIGYGLAEGEAGWNQAMTAINDIAGGDETQARNMINQFQAVAKQAGRSDLSGNTDSSEYNGYRADQSVDLYTKGSRGKPTAIKGDGSYYRGLADRVSAGDMTDMDIKNFTSHLTDDQRAGMDSEALKLTATERAKEQIAIHREELGRLGSSGVGAVHQEALKQRELLDEKLEALSPGNLEYIKGLINDPKVAERARGMSPREARLHAAEEA